MAFTHLVVFDERLISEICAHCAKSLAGDGAKSGSELPAHETVERKIEGARSECEQIHQLAQSNVAPFKEAIAQKDSEQAEDALG